MEYFRGIGSTSGSTSESRIGMSTSEELVVNVTKQQGGDLLNVHKFHYNMLPIICECWN